VPTAVTRGDSVDVKRQVATVVRGVQRMKKTKKTKKTLITRDAPNVRNVIPKPWRWRVLLLFNFDLENCRYSLLSTKQYTTYPSQLHESLRSLA
jgi:hypothetical protein